MVLLRKLNNDPHASMGFLRLQDLQEKIHSKALDINLEDISDPEDSDLKPKKGTEFQLMAKANLSKIK